MTRKIVGLTGYAQTGKDTIGRILVENRGYTRLSFADNVREAVYRLNPQLSYDRDVWEIQEIVDEYGWEWVKVNVPEARRLLQVMGTEVGRQMFGENCWVEMVGRQADGLDRVVITDVRFENEANYVRSLGGIVVRVHRTGTGPVNDHASDRIDFEADAHLYNLGDEADLAHMVLQVDSVGWSSL